MFKFSLQGPSMKEAEFGVMGWVDVEAVPRTDPGQSHPCPALIKAANQLWQQEDVAACVKLLLSPAANTENRKKKKPKNSKCKKEKLKD